MVSLCLFLTVFHTHCRIVQNYTKYKVRVPYNPAPKVWGGSITKVLPLAVLILYGSNAEKLSNTIPRSSEVVLSLSSWFRNQGTYSHFLTISAAGSGRQTVLVPEGTTPIWGERTSVSLHHCLEGQAKNSRRQWAIPYTKTQQEEFSGEIALFTSPHFHVSLKEII